MKRWQNYILVEYPIGDFNNPFDWDMADNLECYYILSKKTRSFT